MNRTFQQTYNLGPTLAANHVFTFVAHANLQLVHLSASNSTANQGTVKIGKTGSDAAYMAAKNVGASGAAAEYGRADFVGGQFPAIPKGETVLVTITDHASHMANVCVVLTLTE